jgi:hypothetical protein
MCTVLGCMHTVGTSHLYIPSISQRVAHCTNALLLLVNQTVEQSIIQQPTGQPHGAFQAGDKFGPGFAAGSYSASGANFKLPSPAQSKHHTATLLTVTHKLS